MLIHHDALIRLEFINVQFPQARSAGIFVEQLKRGNQSRVAVTSLPCYLISPLSGLQLVLGFRCYRDFTATRLCIFAHLVIE